jgi:hypothetical protein
MSCQPDHWSQLGPASVSRNVDHLAPHINFMKTAIGKATLIATLVALFSIAYSLRAGDWDLKHGYHFDDSQKIDVQGVLVLYKAISNSELLIDSCAAKVVTPIKYAVEAGKSFSKEEALKLMEKTLLEKAGIVLTRLDEKRVSVTYNDALPIRKAKSEQ